MKQTFLKTILLLFITIVFTNCAKEEITIEQQSSIETVSITEAQNLFNIDEFSKNSKSKNETYAIANLDFISHEEIDNSNESLTIIPAYTTYSNLYSRILLLKIEGTIESVIFSMVRDEGSNSEQFSGKLYITDLDGNYINAFRVVDDILVSRFLKPTDESKPSKSIFSKGDEEECWGIACGMEGEEVVITASNPGTIHYIPLEILYLNGGGGNINNTWSPISGGGSTGSTGCSEGYVKDSSGNCVSIYTEDDQNKNQLCGTYSFKTIGSASVANISGLGFSAQHPTEGKLAVQLSTLCVTIPNYNLPLSQSSVKFNVAWGLTMNEVLVYLNNTQGIFNPTPTALRTLILGLLTTNLNLLAGINTGVSAIAIPYGCPGVSISPAIYCP